jgi:predicted kinase
MEAVILIGIPASGKTTFYRERFAATHVHISLDVLGTRAREEALLAECLGEKKDFVVDNTNVGPSDRSRYITRARAAGFRVIGYYFKTEVRAALARNKNRTDKKAIPVPGILSSYKRLAPPAIEEGFDELSTIEPDSREKP